MVWDRQPPPTPCNVRHRPPNQIFLTELIHATLQSVLVLLATAVLVVVVFFGAYATLSLGIAGNRRSLPKKKALQQICCRERQARRLPR
jgi:hypothetical protein